MEQEQVQGQEMAQATAEALERAAQRALAKALAKAREQELAFLLLVAPLFLVPAIYRFQPVPHRSLALLVSWCHPPHDHRVQTQCVDDFH